MADELFPVVDIPDIEEESDEYDVEYKSSIKWDTEKGDFVRDSANRLMGCDGREAYMIWCYKTVQTERFACLAYPDEIGVEMEAAMDDNDPEVVESSVQRTITEALMANPRTEEVQGFLFWREGDSLHCSFSVKGINWDEPFQVTI